MRDEPPPFDRRRRKEVTELERDGWEPILTKSRWCLLKRPENLTDSQATKLADLMQYNLKSVEARLLREDFQRFWECVNPKRAAKFLDSWCKEAMRSRLGPMKKVARSLPPKTPKPLLIWLCDKSI